MNFEKSYQNSIESSLLNIVMPERHGEYNLKSFSEKLLQKIGIEGEYLKSGEPEFSEIRNKLNKEPGLIISNHPGYFDMLLVLSSITRDDLKIVVAEKFYQGLSKKFGIEKFIKSTDSSIVEKSCNHVHDGGAVLIFPTGGADTVTKNHHRDDLPFRSGFRRILEKINPDSMIYSFYINPEDSLVLLQKYSDNKTIRRFQLAGHALIPEKLQPIKSSSASTIKVNEEYSKAGDWQNSCDSVQGSVGKNRALSKFYLNKLNV